MGKQTSLMAAMGAIIFSLFIAATSNAATYSVSPNGNNLTGDGSASSPWATLSYACTKVTTAGDVIKLEPGTYNDPNQCVLAVGVSIQGSGKAQTTIVSSLNDWYILASNSTVGPGNQTISGFTLDGNNRTLAHGIYVNGRNNVTIDNVDFLHIKNKAIQLTGYEWWQNQEQEWPPVPPPGYARECAITNVNITGCSDNPAGETGSLGGALWVQSIEDCTFDTINIDESEGTGGHGTPMKGWPGWIKHCTLRNSTFKANLKNIEVITIELWNFETDSEISNCTFYEGYISIVSGRKNGGATSLKFHDNKLINTVKAGVAHELSLDDVEFYNNQVTGEALGLWAATHMYNMDGVSNVNVHDNVFTNTNSQGITLQNGPGAVPFDNVQISRNSFDATDRSWPDSGITVTPNLKTNFSNVSISGNTFKNLAYGICFSGVNAGYIQSPVVTGNTFSTVGKEILDEGASSPRIG